MNLNIDELISIDSTGLPMRPTIRQLQDKDILELYKRDHTKDKINYIKDCGVIYYLGDPKSPPRARGLSDKECLKEAIENFSLPKDYKPDKLVEKLVRKYYIQNITEAGVVLENLQKSLHLMGIAAQKINEALSEMILKGIVPQDKNVSPMANINAVLALMDSVSKRINDFPVLSRSLSQALENLYNEQNEIVTGRGGMRILSSMSADDD